MPIAGDPTMEENGDGGVEIVASKSDSGDDDVVAVAEANTSNSSDSDDADVAKKGNGDDTETQQQNLTAKYHVDRPKQTPTLFADERGNLKFVNLVVRYPCAIFWSILVLCLIISMLLVYTVFMGDDANPFTDPNNQFDMDDVRSIQYDSLRLARDVVQSSREAKSLEGEEEIKPLSQIEDLTYWVFESEIDEGCFGSRSSIESMKSAFDLFLDEKDYENWCYKRYNQAGNESYCDLPVTSLSMYYASEWDSELVDTVIDQLKDSSRVELFNSLALCFTLNLYCDLIPTDISQEDAIWATQLGANITQITSKFDMKGDLVPNITQATELAAYLIQVDVFKRFVDFGYDKNFNATNLVSMFSRGIIWWGGPLNETLTASSDDLSEDANGDGVIDSDDEALLEQEALNKRKDYILDTAFDEMEELADTSSDPEINTYYFMGALIFDVLLKIVARDGLLAIASLVFVFVWLRINTGSFFLAGVGILEVFLSLPVAWFIFANIFQIEYFAFLNALAIFIVAAIGADDIFIFMDAYKQSAYRNPHNLVDLETRMTWVYRRTGTAMAITSATTCAAFLCTLITPLSEIQSFGIFAACVIFVDYVLVMTLFCTSVVIYHDRYEDRRTICGCCSDCVLTRPTPTETARLTLLEAMETHHEDDLIKGDKVSEFFRNRVSKFVQGPINRAVIFLMVAGWITFAVIQTTKIEPTKEAEQFLDEDHPLQRSLDILNSEFPIANDDAGLYVYYTWGLEEVDRDGVNLLFDPENYGQPRFNEDFDFNPTCQRELLKACDTLKTSGVYAPYIKRDGGLGSVRCFIEELAAYNVAGSLENCDYVREGGWRNETWTVDVADINSVMDGFIREFSCLGDSETETILSRYTNDIGFDGDKMWYAALAVESEELNPFSQEPESKTRRNYDVFIDISKELDATVSQACSGGKVIVTDLDQKFVFMNNQAIYVRTAVQASLLGVAIAFTVLLVSTRVLHIAVFASLSIMSVLVSVTGLMVTLGWFLGSIESILIGIIAGFSVDYVVHLAHAYETADSEDTYERLTQAFGDMGISVLNGMVTSVAASIPLFFCQLQFFAKFGTFLCSTIAFSWLFANFAFMSVLATFKIPIRHTENSCSFRC